MTPVHDEHLTRRVSTPSPPQSPSGCGEAPVSVSICTYGIGAAAIRDLVVSVEQAGFDSVWVGEHMVIPGRHQSEHPTQPGDTPSTTGVPSSTRRSSWPTLWSLWPPGPA